VLPEKPSGAVLPFENISGDPEQQYFADGTVQENGSATVLIFWRPASESLQASKPRLPCGVRGGPARNDQVGIFGERHLRRLLLL
jgi:hypothetical protein